MALGVALLALVFRCWRLATVPPGLYVDEVLTARNALAWRLDPHASWLGSRPLLVAGWVETSNPYLAFASSMLRLGGDGLIGARLVSVVPSLLAVALLFGLARAVAGTRVAVIAAALLACSHWAARTGRTGWDAVLMVALQLAALWALVVAQQRRRPPLALLGGALLGLALFTYVASRLALLMALAWWAWEAWARRRDGARASLRGLLAVALGAAVVGGPFVARLLLTMPSQLSVRVGQLSVFALRAPGEPWRTIAGSALAHAAMFNLCGGAYARDDLPGFPLLDPITGVLLLAGVVVVARGWRARPQRLLVAWPVVMALGGVLSVSGEGPPYPYRVASLAPWACLVAGIGGVALWDRARARAPRLAPAMAAIALAVIVATNAWVLFVAGPRYAREEQVYGTAPTTIGRWLRGHREGRPVLVLPAALQSSPPPPGPDPYASANADDFYRRVDAITALQLASGLYAQRPARALEPLRPAGDIDLVESLPPRLATPTLLVLPLDGFAAASTRYMLGAPYLVRTPRGTPVAVAVLAR